ncbi:MAG: hypothetical protein ACUVXA_08450 [Candidatus Jordarchaeum sp.]|uniref:hypothetical protein n=1 Tax=Candidatus Jordarchaeum sp. TaxID=2823881 RepID=UPI00404946E5
MIRHSRLFTILFALALLFFITITPLLSTPSVATFNAGKYSNSQINASSWFLPAQGILYSNKIMLNLLPADNGSFLPSGIFSFRQDPAKSVQFGVYYTHLIEFNDTNQNGIFDIEDHLINTTDLNDFIWFHPNIDSASSEVVLLQTGTSKFVPPIIINFWLHLYFVNKTVPISPSYPKINFGVLGEFTIKTFIQIVNYQWAPEDGNGDYDYRMLALNISLRNEGNEKHLFQLANGSIIDSTEPMINTEPVPSVDEYESLISLITLNNVTRGELRWFNKAITGDESPTFLNSSFMTNGAAFNLYLSVPYYGNITGNTIFLDPSFSMYNPPSDNMLEILQSLFLVLYYYSPAIGLSHLIILGVSTVALIIAIVYYLRRKRI